MLTVLFEDKVEASKTIDKRVEELRPEISFRSQEAVAHRPRVDETQWPKVGQLCGAPHNLFRLLPEKVKLIFCLYISRARTQELSRVRARSSVGGNPTEDLFLK